MFLPNPSAWELPRNLYFIPDGVEDGQAEGGEPEGGPELEGGPEGEPEQEQPTAFHSWTAPDGSKTDWNSPDELTDYLNQGFFRQSDYSRKTDALAQERTQFDSRKSELEALDQRLTAFRKGLESHPALFQEFEKRFTGATSPEDLVARTKNETTSVIDELKNEIKELRSYIDEERFNKQKTSVYGELTNEIEGFNADAVEELLKSIGTDPKALARFAHDALQGKKSPLEAQQLAAEETREEAKLASLGSSKKGSGRNGKSKQPFSSMDEAREAAHAANPE